MPADRPILSPTASGRVPPTPAGDRKVTQSLQPPPQTHTYSLALEKGWFSFLLFFFFSFKCSCSSVPGLSFPWASVVWARSLWPALLHRLLVEGLAVRAGCVALLCVVGKRLASGGPGWPPIILASIKLKHIACLLHNKPQLFHGSN